MKRASVYSVVFCLLVVPIASASDVDLSVPIKMYKAPSVDSSAMQPMMVGPAPPQPTTPGGKLPQYQLGHSRRVDQPLKTDEPRLKFILALPDFPVVVEATITVDGKPFRQAREERVQRLVEFAKNPPKQVSLSPSEPAANVIVVSPSAEQAEENVTDTNEDVELVPADSEAESSDEDLAVDAEVDAVEEEDKEDEEAPEEVDTTPAVPEFTDPASVEERIRRYIAATESVPSADEIRWMLTQRVDGPVVLYLNDNFQRFRADQTPVFKILDRDRDGVVSQKELTMASESFAECDLNRDDIVQRTEIGEVAADPRDTITHAGPGKLIYDFPTIATADITGSALARHFSATDKDEPKAIPRFDTDGDGRLSEAEMELLQSKPADVRVDISFNSHDKTLGTLKITGVSDDFSEAGKTAVVYPNSVVLRLGDNHVELSAVQSTGSDQIAIGAVNDGYPMLPLIDPNDDGQFTIRELRSLNDQLAKFDTNKDGSLTAEENRPPVRLCIGLGAIVHTELSALRSIQPTTATTPLLGPDWFVQMDVNKDNDLSGKEFSGNQEQFAAIDSDSDDLISAEEAVAYEESLKKSK